MMARFLGGLAEEKALLTQLVSSKGTIAFVVRRDRALASHIKFNSEELGDDDAVVAFHSMLPELYRERAHGLRDSSLRAEATEILRAMIEQVVVTPRDVGTFDVALHGELGALLRLEGGQESRCPAYLCRGDRCP